MLLNIFIHLVIMLCNSVRYQYAEREIDENKKKGRDGAPRGLGRVCATRVVPFICGTTCGWHSRDILLI